VSDCGASGPRVRKWKSRQQHHSVITGEAAADHEARLIDLGEHVAEYLRDGVRAAHLVERVLELGVGGIDSAGCGRVVSGLRRSNQSIRACGSFMAVTVG